MKKIIFLITLLILGSDQIILAAQGDQLPQSTLEGQTLSSQLSSPSDDFSDSALPAPPGMNKDTLSNSNDDLSHQGLSSAPQNKSIFQSLNILNLFKKKTPAQQPAITIGELSAQKEPGTTSIPSAATPKSDKKLSASSDDLAHLALTNDIQVDKGTFSFLKPSESPLFDNSSIVSSQGSSATVQSNQSVTAEHKRYVNNPLQTDPDDISHQTLVTDLQGQGIMNILAARDASEDVILSGQGSSTINSSTLDSTVKKGPALVAMAGGDDLSHQAFATAIQDKNNFYFIKTSGAVPIFDKSFRQFLDYGASISFGAGKKLSDNLSLTLAFDMIMLTGDWSVKGDRQSLIFAETQWAPGTIMEPGQTTITAEERDMQPEENLGISVRSEADVLIINKESLKRIDIHTDLYLFPVTINLLKKFNKIGKISPYLGGGFGYCMAVRNSDSKAIKNKYFEGPDYKLTLNNSQRSRGLLLQFLGGLNIPIYKNMMFVAEANTTYYDLKTFDPILEVTFKTPSNPAAIGGIDVSTWSYEDPKRFGVFKQVFVGNFCMGIVMPF